MNQDLTDCAQPITVVFIRAWSRADAFKRHACESMPAPEYSRMKLNMAMNRYVIFLL